MGLGAGGPRQRSATKTTTHPATGRGHSENAAFPIGRRGRWTALVLWLILATALVASGARLFEACGIAVPGGPVLLELCQADTPFDDRLAAERQRHDDLRDRLREAHESLAQLPVCDIPSTPPPAVTELPESVREPTPLPLVVPGPKPEPPMRAEVRPDAPSVEPPASCPTRRTAEVLLVVDASISMKFDYDLDPAIERELDRLQRAGDIISQLQQLQIQERLMQSPGVDRIDIAKRALSRVVTSAPGDIVFGLMTFNQCRAPRFQGRFSAGERPQLLSRIRGITLDNYTALADALGSVPRFVSGGRVADRPVNIVLVSDGHDTCNGDPCAAARTLKAQLPHAAINVIAIGRGLGGLRCVSDATRGLFLKAERADRLNDALLEASGQDLPDHCR